MSGAPYWKKREWGARFRPATRYRRDGSIGIRNLPLPRSGTSMRCRRRRPLRDVTGPGWEERTAGSSRMTSPNRSSVPFSRSGNGLVHLCEAESPSPLSLRCPERVEGSKRAPMLPRPPSPAFRQAQGPSPTPLSSMCLPCPEPLEVLLGKCLVTPVVTLRGTKSAPPARGEGWRRLSRYLPERLFDERAKRQAAGTGIPFGEAANPRPR